MTGAFAYAALSDVPCPVSALARRFQVSRATIQRIIGRRTWAHVA